MQKKIKTKRLYRSRKERMIAGVCGGLSEYFEVDPTLVRLLFIALLVMGGTAIFLYLIMWLVIPLDPVHGHVKKQDK